jgi:hypothetical protein
MPELYGTSDTLRFARTSVNDFCCSHSERFLHSNYAIGSSIPEWQTVFFPLMARETALPSKWIFAGQRGGGTSPQTALAGSPAIIGISGTTSQRLRESQ